jgi:hypothetical protein
LDVLVSEMQDVIVEEVQLTVPLLGLREVVPLLVSVSQTQALPDVAAKSSRSGASFLAASVTLVDEALPIFWAP